MTIKKLILTLFFFFSMTNICQGKLDFSTDGISVQSDNGLYGKISLYQYDIGIRKDFDWLDTNLTYSLTPEGENKEINLNIILKKILNFKSCFYFYCGLPNKNRSDPKYLYQICLQETNTGLTFDFIMEGKEPSLTKLKISKVIDFENFKIEPVFDYQERIENSALFEGGIKVSFPF